MSDVTSVAMSDVTSVAMSEVSVEEVNQHLKEFYEKVPHANSLGEIALRAAMISFLDNKKKRKSHAEYCKTYNKKRKSNSNTDMGHSSRNNNNNNNNNNTKQKSEKLSAAERMKKNPES